MPGFAVPPTFAAMPRRWRDGTGWLDALPALVRSRCAHWDLAVDGDLHSGIRSAATG
jgi:streptomycin 6-kinase